MAGCINCKFHKSKIIGFEQGKSVMKCKCKLGFDKKYTKWWKDNSNKTGKKTDMDCHKYSETTIMLNSLTEKLDKILKKL